MEKIEEKKIISNKQNWKWNISWLAKTKKKKTKSYSIISMDVDTGHWRKAVSNILYANGPSDTDILI